MLHNNIYEFYTCVSAILFIAIILMGQLITYKIVYDFEKMLITEIKRKQIGAISTVIQIKKTFNKLTRNLATESAESNAPPCAPPQDDLTRFAIIKSTLEAILPPLFDNMIDEDATDNHICSSLKYQEIKEYIISRISKKILDYPNLLNLDFRTAQDFYNFEKNIRGEVFRLLLTIRYAGSKARQILKNANDAYYRLESSLDTNLKTKDTADKERNLYDILPSASDEPLAFLIKIETEKEAEAVINKLSEAGKQRLIAEFDQKKIESKGLLFYVESESEYSENENQEAIDIFKYRRQKSSQVKQLDLLFGGDDNV